MKRLLWAFAAVSTSLLFAGVSQGAPATQLTPTVGGGGGGALALYCDGERYLAGLNVRYGNWIDAAGIICASLRGSRPNRSLAPEPNVEVILEGGGGPRSVGGSTTWGGQGGAAGAVRCNADEVVAGLKIQRSPNNFVGHIALRCASLNDPGRPLRAGPAIGRLSSKSPSPSVVDCPSGMVAIGFHGATGNFVDRLGLVCTAIKFVDETIASGMEDNIDRPGSDYARNVLAGRTPDKCQASCAADNRCRAWTYVRPGVQGDRAVCYLKNAVPKAVRNNCCISGVQKPKPGPGDIVRDPGGVVLAPRRCKSGFVWREARATDYVCVTPESRTMAAQENASAASRRDPNGAYGPNTCISGFVWREAFEGDVVCVTPERRTAVTQENQLGPSRTQ